MKTEMQKKFKIYDESASEEEIAKMNGYYRFYGLKQKRYLLK